MRNFEPEFMERVKERDTKTDRGQRKVEVERDKKRKRSKNELPGERGKKAREVRVAKVEHRVKHLSEISFRTFPYGLRDIIELLNHRYNLVRSVFAPFY